MPGEGERQSSRSAVGAQFKFPCTLVDLCGMTVQVPASAGDKTISGVVSMLQEMLDKSKEDGTNDRTVSAFRIPKIIDSSIVFEQKNA